MEIRLVPNLAHAWEPNETDEASGKTTLNPPHSSSYPLKKATVFFAREKK